MNNESYFRQFRKHIIGQKQAYHTPYGKKRLIYADWIASGRLYRPIEEILTNQLGPFVANTHTETSETGRLMTQAYQEAHHRIKKLCHAGNEDVILTTGFGMTGAVVKFQRILGLKNCGLLAQDRCRKNDERPVVFITHMEHHSNHTSWYETFAEVVIVEPGKNLCVDLNKLEEALKKYRDRTLKIGAFTACSNVTGIRTPYAAMAALMHEYGGVAFIDFAASAPYDTIDMHPANPKEKLDAIFFSPHKFLGGPGSAGVLIFDRALYNNKVPDQPGGGTVDWTNPWGEYKFIDNIEIREDGGTPGFLQAIKASLVMELKEKMTVERIHARESELVGLAFRELERIPEVHILAPDCHDRLGAISFYIPDMHYNLLVKLLSDRFGIQVRGGCVCAGTYGHFLLDVSHAKSREITEKINRGDLSEKPGWVRISLHPSMKDVEITKIASAIREITKNYHKWSEDYIYDRHTNEFRHRESPSQQPQIQQWFKL